MTLIDKAEALLPCPFCGSTMQVAMRDAMLCLECYAAGPQDEDRKTAWNRRALPARGVGVDAVAVKNAVMGWVWAEDSDVSKRLGPKHTDALIARILAALEPAPTDAAHVNETPKSEHDAGNVLTAAQAQEVALPRSANRVDYNPDGSLDEIVTDAGVHLEHMGGRRWFLGASRSDGTEIRVWFDGKVTLIEDDATEGRT